MRPYSYYDIGGRALDKVPVRLPLLPLGDRHEVAATLPKKDSITNYAEGWGHIDAEKHVADSCHQHGNAYPEVLSSHGKASKHAKSPHTVYVLEQ